MRVFKPNESGYITNWFVSGTDCTTPQVDFFDQNQLAFEYRLRGVIKDHSFAGIPEDIELGKPGLKDHPWKYYYAGSNWFVDFAIFYRLLTKVELYAYTEIVAEDDTRMPAHVCTYTASDVYLNGELVNAIEAPVYKPITNQYFDLKLKKGVNKVFVRIQDLGVRDTRTIFGLQLKGELDGISIQLPGEEIDAIAAAEDFLNGITYKKGALLSKTEPPCDIFVSLERGEKVQWKSGTEFAMPETTHLADVFAETEGQSMKRSLEFLENFKINYVDHSNMTLEEHRQSAIDALAAVHKAPDKSRFVTFVYDVIARYATGKNTPEDFDLLLNDLDIIQMRPDCADFTLNGMLRLFNLFEIKDERVQKRMKEVCQDFRYWMDEKGSDGMCFWSENHALLFFGCQMLAGKLYPDMLFTRSQRTGQEQYETGARLCREWVHSVLETGFEEFLSGGYTCATTAALLNVIDFGPEDLKADAVKALDKMLRNVCKHTFKGSSFGPQGRVYRGVLFPHDAEVQALINYINPNTPFHTTMWAAGLGCTTYKIPEDFISLMENPISETYPSGNGEVTLLKTPDYLVTSLASPRVSNPGWSNEVYKTEDPYKTGYFTFMYTKALNERFHGTTLFEPGVYGYQQHFMYLVLDLDCIVFMNHPGGTHDMCSNRPGYWYGNGLMPAQRQVGNVIGTVYSLVDEHPVNFTHVYWPTQSFDEEKKEGNWIFGRKGDAYVAVWCNLPFVPHDDVLIGREYRNYGKEIAYVSTAGAKSEDGSFEQFIARAKANDPQFDPAKKTLTTTTGIDVKFVRKHNYSQYI